MTMTPSQRTGNTISFHVRTSLPRKQKILPPCSGQTLKEGRSSSVKNSLPLSYRYAVSHQGIHFFYPPSVLMHDIFSKNGKYDIFPRTYFTSARTKDLGIWESRLQAGFIFFLRHRLALPGTLLAVTNDESRRGTIYPSRKMQHKTIPTMIL
jgi:hypothetical protein